MTADRDTAADGGFAVYVHWPFCAAKCPYCDFNSHVRAAVDQSRWADALLRELDWFAAREPGRQVDSIFFGGGTPSLMTPDTVARVLEGIGARWNVPADVEVTLEANPTSIEAGRFKGYAAAGVNRVSVGLQALNDPDLKALGRLHSVAEGIAAFDVARQHFDRVSFDLIYARQNQSLAAWEAELGRALALGLDHLSLYQLTIEAGTAFGARHAAGKLGGLPDDDLAADMYALTQAMCRDAGFEAYEISNHARPGAACEHNLVYWRSGMYAGIGPGAHGRLGTGDDRIATETIRLPEAWLEAVGARGNGLSGVTPVPAGEQAEEYLMMALRLTEGADLARMARYGAGTPDARIIASLCDDGFLRQEGQRIIATDQGRPVLNAVLRSLLA